MFEDLLNSSLLFLQLLHLQRLTTSSRLLNQDLVFLLNELNVLYPELFADDLQVADGVDVTLDVNDLGIVETSYDLEDGIDGANMRKESVAETGTSRGTACQTSDIVDGKVGGHL